MEDYSMISEEKNHLEAVTKDVDASKEVGSDDDQTTCPGSSPKRIAATDVAAVHAKAELRRNQGNEYFKNAEFKNAIIEYSASIDSCYSLMPQSEHEASTSVAPTLAHDRIDSHDSYVLPLVTENMQRCYSNRAFCHLKMENYGLTIIDSERVINLNASNPKGFYRRGCAFMCLMKYNLAKKDFQQVCKLSKDGDAALRLKECNKLIRQEKFCAAIATERGERLSKSVDIDTMTIPADYTGPKYDDVTSIPPTFLGEMIAYMKDPSNRLPRKLVYQLVLHMIAMLKKGNTLVRIEIPEGKEMTVCGDTHGQFYDLCNIFDINGLPSDSNPYLFNGDFVDRGSFSFEVIFTLLTAKAIYPNHLHLSRGNHETRNMNKIYGFMGEVTAKYDENLYNLFCETFCLLPLAHVINSKIYVVHGGLFGHDNVKLSDIEKIDRDMEPPEEGLMVDMLWSDPQPQFGRSPSKRGVSCNFGPDVTNNFLKANDLSLVIRSHEMKQEGYSVEHDGKMITIFSAPNYCDQMGNQGAFIRLKGGQLIPKFTQFDSVPHPHVPPMKYAHPMLF